MGFEGTLWLQVCFYSYRSVFHGICRLSPSDDDDDGSDDNEGRMEDTENLRSRLRERRRTEERQKATEKEKREVFR